MGRIYIGIDIPAYAMLYIHICTYQTNTHSYYFSISIFDGSFSASIFGGAPPAPPSDGLSLPPFGSAGGGGAGAGAGAGAGFGLFIVG